MRFSDESMEKFEIELANEQVKKIKQAINDCQLRFGKVMGCGTCKALQLCTWAKELSSTIELRQRINNAGFSDEFRQQIKSSQKQENIEALEVE